MEDTSATGGIPRLVVIGATGLIGGGLVAEARRQEVEVVPVGRETRLETVVRSGDLVVNCALHQAYRTGVYDETVDLERQSAMVARAIGARVLMLSTRKVYRPDVQWGARETDPTATAGAGYGPNKAQTERWLRDEFGDDALIVRLSNVFGFEYRPGAPRQTFFGQMLSRLKDRGEILFDMSPETRRDFIPLNEVSRALIAAVRSGATGVLNLGAGAAVACGDVAGAVITGYGHGRLCAADDIRDEFFLDNSKWTNVVGALAGTAGVLSAATGFGEQLRYA